MMATRKLPDISFVRECLDYDPDTGVFTWRERPRSHFISNRGYGTWNARYAGRPAGWRHVVSSHGVKGADVYWAITLNDTMFLGHRVAWFMTHGIDPAPIEIDHIDGIPINNRIANLRLATRQQQTFNRRARTISITGYKGVTENGTGYAARITISGKAHSLGTFPTAEEAASAYREAAIRLHRDFRRSE
jgi:hypothetical protein